MKTFFRETLLIMLMAAVASVLLQTTIQSSPVLGSSMQPTLMETGQRLLISRLVYRFHEPQRGDIITFHPPSNPDPKARPFIKRVIGLPGETVEIRHGQVYINGLLLAEPYIVKEKFTYTMAPQVVPADHYFVLGDNRNISDDSHLWGTIAHKDIIGKAWISIWPPSKWGLAPNYTFVSS